MVKEIKMYGCDFCDYTTESKELVELHESRCFSNPHTKSCKTCALFVDASGNNALIVAINGSPTINSIHHNEMVAKDLSVMTLSDYGESIEEYRGKYCIIFGILPKLKSNCDIWINEEEYDLILQEQKKEYLDDVETESKINNSL